MEYTTHLRSAGKALRLSDPSQDIAQPTLPARRNGWAQVYLAIAGVIALAHAVMDARRHAPWPLGDWLTNYQGGFVRRGLTGAVLLGASHGLKMPLVAVAACLQTACVLTMLLCLRALVRDVWRPGAPLWARALLFSPATVAFVWLDPTFALRKEILLFAILALLIASLRLCRPRHDVWISVFLSVTLPLLLLSHEGLVCYLPYLWAATALGRRDPARAIRIFAAPAVLSAGAVWAAVQHPGNHAVAEEICRSLIANGSTGLCWGPIWYLGMPRSLYRGEVSLLLHDVNMLALLAITGLLALLPAAVGFAALWRRPVSVNTRWVLPGATGFAALASVMLFAQAQDWGRWIYIHAMCLSLLLLFAASERTALVPAAPASSRRRAWAAAGLLLYATMWNLPTVGERAPLGYVALLFRLKHHFLEPVHASSL